MQFILLNLRDSDHSFFAARLSFLKNSFCAPDLLQGSSFLNGAGSLFDGLDPSLAAFLASPSAALFPSIPIWPGVLGDEQVSLIQL